MSSLIKRGRATRLTSYSDTATQSSTDDSIYSAPTPTSKFVEAMKNPDWRRRDPQGPEIYSEDGLCGVIEHIEFNDPQDRRPTSFIEVVPLPKQKEDWEYSLCTEFVEIRRYSKGNSDTGNHGQESQLEVALKAAERTPRKLGLVSPERHKRPRISAQAKEFQPKDLQPKDIAFQKMLQKLYKGPVFRRSRIESEGSNDSTNSSGSGSSGSGSSKSSSSKSGSLNPRAREFLSFSKPQTPADIPIEPAELRIFAPPPMPLGGNGPIPILGPLPNALPPPSILLPGFDTNLGLLNAPRPKPAVPPYPFIHRGCLGSFNTPAPPFPCLSVPNSVVNRPPPVSKPQDPNTPEQQAYEAWVEWRKANEPGYALECKLRQQRRAQRGIVKRLAVPPTASAVATASA